MRPDAAAGARIDVSGHPPVVLAPGQVEVWSADVAACRDEAPLGRYRALLSAAERERNRRFAFARDRDTDLVARALVRTVLGRCMGLPPEALVFERAAFGKPRLAGGPPTRFNLSHCHDRVLLAVSRDLAVGIDLERMDRKVPMEIAPRVFTRHEIAAMARLDPAGRDERFWSLWTLKESLIKATGRGLGTGLDGVEFELDRSGCVALRVLREAEDDRLRAPWWFGQWRSHAHMIALCVEAGAGAPTVRLRETVPLRDERLVPLALERVSDAGARRPSAPPGTQ